MLCTPHEVLFPGSQVKKTEMGKACVMYGGKQSCIQRLVGEI